MLTSLSIHRGVCCELAVVKSKVWSVSSAYTRVIDTLLGSDWLFLNRNGVILQKYTVPVSVPRIPGHW